MLKACKITAFNECSSTKKIVKRLLTTLLVIRQPSFLRTYYKNAKALYLC